MSTNNQIETVVSECLRCGYPLRELVPSDPAKCPECGYLVKLSQEMSGCIDQLGWPMCVQLRRGANIFCIGIAIAIIAILWSCIPGSPWFQPGGLAIGLIVSAVGTWKLSIYYTHRKIAFLPFVGLRSSAVMLSVFLIAAAILLVLVINPPGTILLRDLRWNIVWLGLLVGILLSLGLMCFFLLHLFSSISSRCGIQMLGSQISKTRLLTILFGVGMLGMFIWNSNDQTPYERTIFNIKLYQTYLIFLAILSFVMLGSWGRLIYSLKTILKVPKESHKK